MPYLSQSGRVLENKSPWRLSYIPEVFWGAVNFVILFFRTMFSPDLTSKGSGHSSDYRQGLTSDRRGPGGPPAPPRRRIGGFGGRGSGPAAPPAAGGG